MKWNFL